MLGRILRCGEKLGAVLREQIRNELRDWSLAMCWSDPHPHLSYPRQSSPPCTSTLASSQDTYRLG